MGNRTGTVTWSDGQRYKAHADGLSIYFRILQSDI